jgi:hypothetical protein
MNGKIRVYILFFILFIVSVKGFSQLNISGSLSDKSGNVIPGAIIKVTTPDSVFVTVASSDTIGNFVLTVNTNQKYLIKISYLGYADIYKTIETGVETITLGKIILKETAQTLSEVEVKTTQIRGEQKGDTTQFNADSFKTNPDASAEDLIKKMPGVTSDNNGVKVNGETVQKILVDGKPFFGDDPNAALKNLPADIIDKVEIFDKMSDQSAFTGFNDGNEQKTINIVTKKGKNVGTFGKVYGGYGSDERYNGGATINNFNSKRRISLLLLSNNINQQNFSAADITGAMSNAGSSGGRGGGGRGGNSPESPLMISPQNGNTATQAAGLNYSDAWGKKITVSGSYFFNYTDNINNSDITRNYFTDNNLIYKQINDDRIINQNHRTNLRLEYNIDSANKIILSPSLSFQNNATRSNLSASNIIFDNQFLSNTETFSLIDNIGYDFSNFLMYQHKFSKKARSISLSINTTLTEKNNDGTYISQNNYGDTLSSGLDQTFVTYSNSKKISANLSYTEPLNKNTQLQISYNPSYTEGLSNKSTNDYDSVASDYTDFNSALSNKYNNIYQTQKGGLSYKYQKEKLNLSIGVDAQQSTLSGQQTFPLEFKVNRDFQNILPNARLNYKFSKAKNLRINYRSSTNIPSISQLQNVVDISNPLQVRSGNPDLKQTFENNLNIRYGGFNAVTSRNAMLFINGNYTDNYISNATYILQSDSVIQGYLIKAGSQLITPVNLNGFYSARTFFVYGFPVAKIKSNLNVNGGVIYNHTPSLINDKLNISDNYALNGGVYIGSNVSKNLDFSLSYNGTYNIVKNSVQKQSDNNFVTQATTFKLNWIFLDGFVVNTDVVYTIYSGLNQSYNQNYFLWNAYVGYKFFKDRSLEAKVSVFDLLDQNRSIGRTVTGNYTEDFNTTVLKRYFMFTLTYTFKKFKSGTQPKSEIEEDPLKDIPGMPKQPRGGGGY